MMRRQQNRGSDDSDQARGTVSDARGTMIRLEQAIARRRGSAGRPIGTVGPLTELQAVPQAEQRRETPCRKPATENASELGSANRRKRWKAREKLYPTRTGNPRTRIRMRCKPTFSASSLPAGRRRMGSRHRRLIKVAGRPRLAAGSRYGKIIRTTNHASRLVRTVRRPAGRTTHPYGLYSNCSRESIRSPIYEPSGALES